MPDASAFIPLLRFEVAVDADGPVVDCEVAERHRQANGVVHGSVVHAMLDTVMGLTATRATARPVATAEISIRYLEPVFDGRLSARARVVKAGKRLIVMTGEVRRGDLLVAIGQATFTTIRDG
jgi:uncharacterized protein (TIGR00369 family)